MEKQMNLENSIATWLTTRKEGTIKPASYERLRVSLKQLGKYPIANRSVQSLTSDDLQTYLGQLRDDGYALTTIKKQQTLLSDYLKYAYGCGIIALPIYINVGKIRETAVRKKRKQVETYSHQEQKKLMRIFETLDNPLYGAAILMMEEGLRIGEVLALTWGDIQWGRRAVRVHRTVVRLTTQANMTFVQDIPKSESSIRTIPLSDAAMRILERLNENTSSDYIFADPKDPEMPCTYEAARYHISAACRKAGVPYKGTHIFRHTFATNCYDKGCDVKILSKLLGHSDVSITYNIYIHLYGDALEEMRNIVR